MRSSLRWPGGKAPLASWIVGLMPQHVHYVEPYFGAGSVLFEKDPEGVSEVVNDTNAELTRFWKVLQEPATFDYFRHRLEATPVSQTEWCESSETVACPVENAIRFFIRVRQSLAARQQAFTALTRRRTRRGMNAEASAWLTAVEGLAEVHERLKRVVILHDWATNVIQAQDGPDTLFYLDPPYLHETRRTTTEYGTQEMSREEHVWLLDVIKQSRGKVMLSGYRSELYDTTLAGWTRHEKEVANHASHATEKGREVECVWCNFP